MRSLLMIILVGGVTQVVLLQKAQKGMPPGSNELAIGAGTAEASASESSLATGKDRNVVVQKLRAGSEPVQTAAHPRDAFEKMLQDLRTSMAEIRKIPNYTATWEQQVQIGETLREPIFVDIKVRHSPFSVYMKWCKDGQEVLYVEGQNDGRLLARPTRGLVALRGVWKIRPDSPQAMRDTRYPVTEIGIEKLCLQAWSFHEDRQFSLEGLNCTAQHCLADGKPATQYNVTFDVPDSAIYSRSCLTFDDESKLLIAMENYGWGASGQPGELIEKYVYHNIQPAPDLDEQDFSEQNPDYKFVGK